MTKLKNKFIPKGIQYRGHIYEKPEWAINQVINRYGHVEDICRHGVSHPNEEWLKKK